VKLATWRQVIAAATLVCVFTSCARTSPEDAAGRWAATWVGALNSRRIESIVSIMDTHATLNDPTLKGPIAVALLPGFWSNMWRLFPDLTFRAQRVVAEGERVAIEWHATGTGGNGKPLNFDGVYVLEVHDGHITYDSRVYLPFLAPNAPH